MGQAKNLFIRFERPRDDVDGPIFGPYPFVQVTFDELRVGPDGDVIAVLNENGEWELADSAGQYSGEKFSDIVIYAE